MKKETGGSFLGHYLSFKDNKHKEVEPEKGYGRGALSTAWSQQGDARLGAHILFDLTPAILFNT